MNFLPREEKFYALFAEQSRLIVEASEVLVAGVKAGNSRLAAAAVEIGTLEERGDTVIHELLTKLHSSFITPLDPEDIHSLGTHMDDVLDGIEDSIHRMVAYRMDPIPPVVLELCDIVYKCALQLQQAMAALDKDKQILPHCIEINRLEGEADRLVRIAIAELFEKEKDPIQLIKTKEIYEFLEQTTDYCEDVADALQNVVVKNS